MKQSRRNREAAERAAQASAPKVSKYGAKLQRERAAQPKTAIAEHLEGLGYARSLDTSYGQRN